MSDQTSYHMTPDEFRQYGRAVIDWIADYYQAIESFPVLSPVEPGQIRLACRRSRRSRANRSSASWPMWIS